MDRKPWHGSAQVGTALEGVVGEVIMAVQLFSKGDQARPSRPSESLLLLSPIRVAQIGLRLVCNGARNPFHLPLVCVLCVCVRACVRVCVRVCVCVCVCVRARARV